MTEFSNTLTQAGEDVRHQAESARIQAEGKLQQTREQAAGWLSQTATKVRDLGQNKEGNLANAANTAADRIEGTASYLREHDLQDVVDDTLAWTRRQPGPALAVAAGVGFLLGMAFRRR